MQRFKIAIVAVMCLLVMGTILTSLPFTRAEAQGRGVGVGGPPNDVNVVNTPTVNAQQSGTWSVAVSGTPTVNAQQSGTWNVGIKGLTNRVTTSTRGVISAGEVFTNVPLVAPNCSPGTTFLVTDVYAGPEVLIGATSINVVQLNHWAISVPVYQFSGGGAVQVALTALGNGPQAISASIPGGQQTFGSPILATVLILGGGGAPQRFEFNVHLTGFCGVGFTQ